MNDPKLVSVSRIRQIISLIDLTNLNDPCDGAAIDMLCRQASTPVGSVAALCVWPAFVPDARKFLGPNSPIKIATVVNFPTGAEPVNTTCSAIEKALDDGAHEIDYVLPFTQLINNNTAQVSDAVAEVRKHVPNNRTLKVILETGVLEKNELIRTAAGIAIDQGANFIKTSTGKVPVNATAKAAAVMLDAIARSKQDVGFKAAGGIKTIADADEYLKLAEQTFDPSWINTKHFRFGASGLLQDALVKLDLASSSAGDDAY